MMQVEPYQDAVDGKPSAMMEIDVDENTDPNDEIVDPRLHGVSHRNRKVYIGIVIGSRRKNTKESASATSPALSDPVTFIPPPDDLGTICDSLDTKDRRNACEIACAPSECCDRPAHMSPLISCLNGHLDECHTYHVHCSVLDEDYQEVTTPVSFPPAPPNLMEMCSMGTLEFHSGQMECQKMCELAKCCYEDFDQINATCADMDVCKDYAVCHNLKAVKDKHHDVGFLVEEMCSGDVHEDSHHAEICMDLCRPANCCFNPHVICLGQEEHGDDYCSQYKGCEVIFHQKTPSETFEEVSYKCEDPHHPHLEHDPHKFPSHHIPIHPTKECIEFCKEKYECCRTQDPSTCKDDCHDLAVCHYVYPMFPPAHLPGDHFPPFDKLPPNDPDEPKDEVPPGDEP